MKKILITVFTFITVSTAFAQTQKGNVIVGADLASLGVNFQEGNTLFSFDLSPKAAWFIRDNTALGAEVNLGLNTQKGATSVQYGVGAIGRKYFGTGATDLARTTKWFAEANVGIYGTNTSGDDVVHTSTNGLGLGIGPGLAYFVNSNIALEALAKYNLTVGFGNSTTNNAINFGLGFQIYFSGKQAEKINKKPLK